MIRTVWMFVVIGALAMAGGVIYLDRQPAMHAPELPILLVSPDSKISVSEVVLDDAIATPLDLTIIGRPLTASDNPAGFAHLWPGIYANASFSGTEVLIAFDDAINRYAVFVDDFTSPVITVNRPGQITYRLADLPPGAHIIRVEKISESFQPDGTLRGIYVTDAANTLPPPRSKDRQMAFIGDSDTVGFGNLAPMRECDAAGVFAWTDTRQTFGPMVAAHFDADYTMTARSGIGLVRNYADADQGTEMASIYKQQLGPEPDVIVIALGSNDFATPVLPDGRWANVDVLQDDFHQTYLRFLDQLQVMYPDAMFALVTIANYGAEYLAAHDVVMSNLTMPLAQQVVLVPVGRIDQDGCNWHPSLRDHKMIADTVIAALQDHIDTWAR